MKNTAMILALLGSCAVAAIAGDPVGPPMPLHLTSVGAAGGFSDPNKERANAMKDLTEALGRERTSS